MFSTSSTNSRLLSAALLDKEQLEDNERLRRLGETQRRTASALLLPPGRCTSAPDPITEGFFGTSLFGNLFSRQGSNRRDSDLVSQFGGLDLDQKNASSSSRRGSYIGNTNMVSLLDREQLSSSRSRKRSYSLVSLLDTTQTRESSSYRTSVSEPRKPRELTQLNTLEEAIPVARAAAKFRSVIHSKIEDDDEVNKKHGPDTFHKQRGRNRRKSHSLY